MKILGVVRVSLKIAENCSMYSKPHIFFFNHIFPLRTNITLQALGELDEK